MLCSSSSVGQYDPMAEKYGLAAAVGAHVTRNMLTKYLLSMTTSNKHASNYSLFSIKQEINLYLF